jgi:hypothetical protein
LVNVTFLEATVLPERVSLAVTVTDSWALIVSLHRRVPSTVRVMLVDFSVALTALSPLVVVVSVEVVGEGVVAVGVGVAIGASPGGGRPDHRRARRRWCRPAATWSG